MPAGSACGFFLFIVKYQVEHWQWNMSRIVQDEQEFLKIIHGILKRGDLKGLIKQGQIPIPTGHGKGVVIRIPWIEIPHIVFRDWPLSSDTSDSEGDGDTDAGPDIGVGQGDGRPGTDLGPAPGEGNEGENGDGEDSDGERQAGQGRGHDYLDVDIETEDFIKILFEDVLKLPRIKPKGDRSIKSEERKYTDISKVGPDSLRHKRRTLKQALKRSIAEGQYDPKQPRIIPVRDDFRYRRAEPVIKKKHAAVVFYMMDVSGSMMEEDRKVVRYFCWLTSLWLKFNYGDVDEVYIIHDGEADEVDQETFFRTNRGGGTTISSAHKKALEIIQERYPPERWNIYINYFSDGFNWGGDDEICMDLIGSKILPIVNLYAYGETAASHFWFEEEEKDDESIGEIFSPAGSFGVALEGEFGRHPLVKGVNLESLERVPEAIKTVFKDGK